MIFNYNNTEFSRQINCEYLYDCTGNTITKNGTTGLRSVLGSSVSQKGYEDIFHVGIEVTAILGILSLSRSEFRKPATIAISALVISYVIGRYMLKE